MSEKAFLNNIKTNNPSLNMEEIEKIIPLLIKENSYYLIRFKLKRNPVNCNINYLFMDNNGKEVGDATATVYSWNIHEAELTYGIAEDWRGQGLGTRLLETVVRDIYENHPLNNLSFKDEVSAVQNICLTIDCQNIGSIKVAENSGFVGPNEQERKQLTEYVYSLSYQQYQTLDEPYR
ncbi:MAG: GNAT family N-acetyltransferase [Clostridia bacterium]|nr:GNAT family N-acetyltransferase [Clostridia bacterium]